MVPKYKMATSEPMIRKTRPSIASANRIIKTRRIVTRYFNANFLTESPKK